LPWNRTPRRSILYYFFYIASTLLRILFGSGGTRLTTLTTMQTVKQNIYPPETTPDVKGLGCLSVVVVLVVLVGTIVSAFYFATTQNAVTYVSNSYDGPQCQGLSRAIVHRQFWFVGYSTGTIFENLTCEYTYEVQMNSDCAALEALPAQLQGQATSLVAWCNGNDTLYEQLSGNVVGEFKGVPFANSLTCTIFGNTSQLCAQRIYADPFIIVNDLGFQDGQFSPVTGILPSPGSAVDCLTEVVPATSLFLCSKNIGLRWDSVVAQTFGIASLVFTVATFVARRLFVLCCKSAIESAKQVTAEP